MNVLTIAAGAAVLLGVGYLVFRTKPATQKDVDTAVDRALISERNTDVLRTFAKKLDAAGRTTQAVQVLARADAISKGLPSVVAKQVALAPAAIQVATVSQSLARF